MALVLKVRAAAVYASSSVLVLVAIMVSAKQPGWARGAAPPRAGASDREQGLGERENGQVKRLPGTYQRPRPN